MSVLVKDIMSKPVVAIDKNKSAKDAGTLMKKIRRGFLVVVDKNKAIGVLSDSDLIKHVIVTNKKASDVKVKDIMAKVIVTVKPNDQIIEAVRKMKKSNLHRLPVLEAGKTVGIISLTDIARTSPEMLDLLEYRLQMKENPVILTDQTTSGLCESCNNYSDDLRNTNEGWACADCREATEA